MNHGFNVVSALQRGIWAIEPLWALQHLQSAEDILAGKFTTSAQKEGENEEIDRVPVATVYVDDSGFWRPIGGKDSYSNAVKVISIEGPIFKNGTWCSYGTKDWTAAVWEAYQDPNISAVLLDIDSPGGQVSGIPSLYDAVRNPAKPTVSFCNDGMMCSGGYYIAAGSDAIVSSQRTDMIGSIGVYTRLRDLRDYYAKEGIRTMDVYAKQSTEKHIEIRRALEGDLMPLVEELSQMAEEFIGAVKASRGSKLKETEKDPFKGGSFYAPQAQEMGLIDEIMSLGETLSMTADMGKTKTKKSYQLKPIDMFGNKFKTLTAVQGIAAADITEDHLEAINAQLKGEGIEGVAVVNASWIAEAETLQATANAAEAKAKQLEATNTANATKMAELEAQIGNLSAERDSWKEKAEAYGSQPGAVATRGKSDKASEGEGDAETFATKTASLSHNKLAKEYGL